MTKKYDIAIYGAGFVGMTTALSLAPYARHIALIEPLPIDVYRSKFASDNRTTALSFFSKKFFEQINFWNKISSHCGAIKQIEVLDYNFVKGTSPLNLEFGQDTAGDEPMGYIIGNDIFKTALLDEVEKLPNIDIISGFSFADISQNDNSVTISSDTKEITADVLIAADGRFSRIRDYLKFPTIDKSYHQTAITFNIFHANSHANTALEKFTPSGPFALLPLVNENNSSVVWTVSSQQAEILMQLSDEDFAQEFSRRYENYYGDFSFITEPKKFPLSLKLTKQLVQGRVALIADTAHAMHPLAGQGYNQGVKDIAQLAALVSKQTSLGLPITESTLNQYQKNRHIDNLQMIAATDGLNSLFSNDNSVLRPLRRIGISAVNNIPKIKNFFVTRARGAHLYNG